MIQQKSFVFKSFIAKLNLSIIMKIAEGQKDVKNVTFSTKFNNFKQMILWNKGNDNMFP